MGQRQTEGSFLVLGYSLGSHAGHIIGLLKWSTQDGVGLASHNQILLYALLCLAPCSVLLSASYFLC